MNKPQLICRKCKAGHLQESTRTVEFHPNGKLVTVEVLGATCDHCGATTSLGSQIEENSRRLAARKEQYEGQLLGEEYLALRKRYGLTQQIASRIFGKGKIAFSRYENEETFPDASTRKLIEQAIANPSVLKALADEEGVTIPLWLERSEDEQRIKVRPLLVAQGSTQRKSQSGTFEASGIASPGNIVIAWANSTVVMKKAINDESLEVMAG